MSDINVRIHRAIVFATKAHAGQKRKASDVDYICHPVEVMNNLSLMGADEELIIAGVLHDTVEDTYVTLDDIEKEFGSEVRRLVASHTEDKSKTWMERKTNTINHLLNAPKDEKMLVLADMTANARSIYCDIQEIGDEVWNRFKATKDEEEYYYRGVLEAISNLKDEENTSNAYEHLDNLINEIYKKL